MTLGERLRLKILNVQSFPCVHNFPPGQVTQGLETPFKGLLVDKKGQIEAPGQSPCPLYMIRVLVGDNNGIQVLRLDTYHIKTSLYLAAAQSGIYQNMRLVRLNVTRVPATTRSQYRKSHSSTHTRRSVITMANVISKLACD